MRHNSSDLPENIQLKDTFSLHFIIYTSYRLNDPLVLIDENPPDLKKDGLLIKSFEVFAFAFPGINKVDESI